MSPRNKVLRKVARPPVIKGFLPFGGPDDAPELPFVSLFFEEYEALRLSDYEQLNHHQASLLMSVSRPTFTRIYASGLQKIARAFIEGRPIRIEGGKVLFDSNWHQCRNCHSYFNQPENAISPGNCPLCGSDNISSLPDSSSETDDSSPWLTSRYFCRDCGYEQSPSREPITVHPRCPQCKKIMYPKRAFKI